MILKDSGKDFMKGLDQLINLKDKPLKRRVGLLRPSARVAFAASINEYGGTQGKVKIPERKWFRISTTKIAFSFKKLQRNRMVENLIQRMLFDQFLILMATDAVKILKAVINDRTTLLPNAEYTKQKKAALWGVTTEEADWPMKETGELLQTIKHEAVGGEK